MSKKVTIPISTHVEVTTREARIFIAHKQLQQAVHPMRIATLNSIIRAQVYALIMAFSRGARNG